jgi:hypothetical protein
MSGLKATTKTNKKKALRALGAAVLLFFYLAGNTSSGILHQLFHQRLTTVSHSQAQEKDVCHRAIYHFGKDPKHNSHFAVSDQGDNCNVFAHTEQILVSNAGSKCIEPEYTEPKSFPALSFASISILLPSRAPPLI